MFRETGVCGEGTKSTEKRATSKVESKATEKQWREQTFANAVQAMRTLGANQSLLQQIIGNNRTWMQDVTARLSDATPEPSDITAQQTVPTTDLPGESPHRRHGKLAR